MDHMADEGVANYRGDCRETVEHQNEIVKEQLIIFRVTGRIPWTFRGLKWRIGMIQVVYWRIGDVRVRTDRRHSRMFKKVFQ